LKVETIEKVFLGSILKFEFLAKVLKLVLKQSFFPLVITSFSFHFPIIQTSLMAQAGGREKNNRKIQ